MQRVTDQQEPGPSILIVDPDADTRMLYRTVFEDQAGSIVEAEDGAEALGKAICYQPDVVVTETRLGRIDGYALCRYLRHRLLTQSAAIVVVTSEARPAEIARAAGAGADEVLVKPCLPDALIEAAHRSLRRHRGLARAGAVE